jgi:uncharacterized tellurite resistance protein B-like protein
MTPIERLYYALGELAYAIAKADGIIQKEEKEKLHGILETEFRTHKVGFDISEIIFQILQKDGTDSKTAYDNALYELKLNSQYVSEHLKTHFIAVMKKVGEAFPPVTQSEGSIIDDFIYQVKSIKGDEVFSAGTE